MAYKYRDVDLDLFVDAASKGWNDGAKVPGPFASFMQGLSQGIDQYYVNEEKAANTERIQIANELAPYEKIIKENQAAKAQIESQVIKENPDVFKDTIVNRLETERAQREQAAAYEAKKVKLVDLANAQDYHGMGDAYNDPKNEDVFLKDRALNEQYRNTYSKWRPDSKEVLQATERQQRELATIEKKAEAMAAEQVTVSKDYFKNQELNGLKANLGNLSDTEFLENSFIKPNELRPPLKPVYKLKDPKIDPKTGEYQLDAKGNFIGKGTDPLFSPKGTMLTEYDYSAPTSSWKPTPVLFYKGNEVASDLSADAIKHYNNYKANYNFSNNQDQGQGGSFSLAEKDKRAQEIKTAQEANARTKESEAGQRAATDSLAFTESAKVAPKYAVGANRYVENVKSPPAAILPPAATNQVPKSNEAVPAAVAPTSATVATPSSGQPPGTVAAFNAYSSLNKIGQPEKVMNLQTGMKEEKPSWIKQLDAERQMIATKAAQSIERNRKAGKPAPSPTNVPPKDQAAKVVSSSFIPQNVEVKSPYVRDINQNDIINVASNPDLSGLSAFGKAVALQESKGRNSAVSHTGVPGYMQMTKGTANEIIPGADRRDPKQSVALGGIYLEQLLANPAYGNNPMLAFTAYNAGDVMVSEVINRAKTTDWQVAKNHLFAAASSRRVQMAWFSDFRRAGYTPEESIRLARGKIKEAVEYADKVVVNVPAFLYSRQDMEGAMALRNHGVLVF